MIDFRTLCRLTVTLAGLGILTVKPSPWPTNIFEWLSEYVIPPAHASNHHSSTLEELRSLPYLSWSQEDIDQKQSGVMRYDKKKAFDGYNLYTDDSSYAYLMNMTGQIVYSWRFPPPPGKWEYFRLLDNGDIVALCVGKTLVKLNQDSQLIWRSPVQAHHDIEVLPDGTFLATGRLPPVPYKGRNVQFDAIFHVSERGETIGRWSTYEHLAELQKNHFPSKLDNENIPIEPQAKSLKTYDYYHLNTIQTLPDTLLGQRDKKFQEGNWLTCLRNTDLICILDKDSRAIVWSWGPGELDWPHMPQMLDNGNILIFDNGTHRKYSRVIEIDPVCGRILWEYKTDPPQNFYSEVRGSSQRLPNGNTLICESERGHVFEVTESKEVVWEFYNPEMKDGKRKLIYRMIRIPKAKADGWLKKRWGADRN